MPRRSLIDTPSICQQNKLTAINDVIENLFGQFKKVKVENDRMKKLVALLLHFKYMLQFAVENSDFDNCWKSTVKHQSTISFKENYNTCLSNFASFVEELQFVSEIENQYQNNTDQFCLYDELFSNLIDSRTTTTDPEIFNILVENDFTDDQVNNDFNATSNFLQLEYGDNEEQVNNILASNCNGKLNSTKKESKNKRNKLSLLAKQPVKKKTSKIQPTKVRSTTTQNVKRIRKRKVKVYKSNLSDVKASIPVANSNKPAYERLSFLKSNPLYTTKIKKTKVLSPSENSNSNDAQFSSTIEVNHCIFSKFSDAIKLFYKVRQNEQEKQYLCEVEECGFIHNLKTCMETHVLKHFNLKPFGCSMCEYRTDSRKSYFRHAFRAHQITANLLPYMDYFKTTVDESTGSNVFTCKFSHLCTFEARQASSLMDHVNFHLNQSPFKCAHCDLRFSNLTLAKQHLLKKHNKSFLECPYENCTLLTTEQVDLESLLNHIKEHHQFVNNVSASFCSSYSQPSTSNKRCFDGSNDVSMLAVKRQQTTSLWDETNGSLVNFANGFLNQQNTSENVPCSAVDFQQLSYACSYKNCFYKSYNSWTELKEHEYNCHIKLPFSCPVNSCFGAAFQTKDILNQHFIERHGFSPFYCGVDDCNRLFINSFQLYSHLNEDHSDAYIACNKCQKLFDSRVIMMKHFRVNHIAGEFHCSHDSCQFVGNFKADLERHTSSEHTFKRMKKCPVEECGQVMRKHSYERHMARYHNVNFNVCSWPDCDKSFMDRKSLKDHLRIHMNFKRFLCKWPGCGYASEQRSNTIKHVRIRHLKLPYTKREELLNNITSKQRPQDYIEVLPEQINI